MTQLRVSALVPVYDRWGVCDYARVDEADYEHLTSVGRWSIRGDGYAAHGFRQADGAYRWLSMHRYLLGMKKGDGLHVDHRNHDKLDNRRANLRILTPAQHAQFARARGVGLAEALARAARRDARRRRFEVAA